MRPRVRAALTVAVALLMVMVSLVSTSEADADRDFDVALIDLVNDWRASQGLPAVTEYAGLTTKAVDHSAYMASGSSSCASAGSRWGHSTLSLSDGSNPPGAYSLSENISYACGTPGFEFARTWSTAAGPLPAYCTSPIDYTSPEATMCGWLSSPSHRPAIANPNHTHLGSGTATVRLASGGVERFATHVFASATVSASYDVTCDGRMDITDALVIAQYTTGTRTDAGSCNLTDPARQLNARQGDVDRNGVVNILDALRIAQCVTGLESC